MPQRVAFHLVYCGAKQCLTHNPVLDCDHKKNLQWEGGAKDCDDNFSKLAQKP